MKHLVIIIFSIFSLVFSMQAQQNDDLKFNLENQFLINPAAISSFNELRVSTYYLKQFTAVENAPTDMFVSFQSPIPYQRLSAGFGVLRESAGLMESLRINLSGAYRLPRLFNPFDYLSIGLGLNYNNFGINGAGVDLVDNSDPLSNIGDQRASGFNVGVGLFYASNSKIDYRNGKKEMQVGISAAKVIPQSINFSSLVYKEVLLFSGFGAVYLPVKNSFLNPYAEIQLEDAVLSNINIGLRAILKSSLILGVSGDLDGALGIQVGYRTPEVINGGSLQIIAQSIVPLGPVDRYINTGFGLSIQYAFDMSNFL